METSTTSNANSATRALVTSLGAGSGIDMGALAENLAAAQFAARIDRLAAKSEVLDRQISAASNLRSMMLGLATSLGDRIRLGDLAPTPRIANSAVAQGSLSGSSQPTGSYTLEVTALAAAQTLAGPAFTAATDPAGAGSLKLRFGTIAGTSFTQDLTHAAVDITIASGSSLADVASAINGANAGVSAYIANTVDGAQLVLKGETGAANGFILEAVETPGEVGLASLAWNPTGNPARLLASSRDAAFKVDGLAMTAVNNTVVDAIPGVTLELTGTNTGSPTRVSFNDPSKSITEAMGDLVSALNEIVTELNTAVDPKTGDLARDGGARALSRRFSGLAGTIIMPGLPDGTPATLSDLGLETQRNGTFTFNATRLAAALTRDPEAVAAMFTTGVSGVYGTIDGISRAMSVVSDPGSLAGSVNRYTEQLQQVTEDQAELAEKQEEVRLRLTARFAVSDSRIGAARSTLTFLQGQIDAWNGQNR